MSRTLRDIAFDQALANFTYANPNYVWGQDELSDVVVTDDINQQADKLMEEVPQWMKGCE